MTNLTERLDKHLQNVKESNGKITEKELWDIIQSNKNKIKRLEQQTGGGWTEFRVDEVDHPHFADELEYQAYCICNYLNIESGISINDAYRSMKDGVDFLFKLYKDCLKTGDNLQTWYDYYNSSEAAKRIKNLRYLEYLKNEFSNYMKNAKSRSIDPKTIAVWTDDSDGGDGYHIDDCIFALKLAKACGATELANKIKPLSDKIEWLKNHTIDF